MKRVASTPNRNASNGRTRVEQLESQLAYERSRVERQRFADAQQLETEADLQQRIAEHCSNRASRSMSLALAATLRDLAKTMRSRAVIR